MKRSSRFALFLLATVGVVTLSACASTHDRQVAETVCSNRTGEHGGYFYTFWHDSGDACISLQPEGAYAMRWDVRPNGNMVSGKGWRTGSPDRVVRYLAETFEPGTNGYLTLYGWSTDPLVEYYVVDSWGSNFKPPGEEAEMLGTVESDGGTYRIYRTVRVAKPSIRGTQTFPQFWSVRTERRPLGQPATITFANHVRAWEAAGLRLGQMNYQVMATEGFGSEGRSQVTILP